MPDLPISQRTWRTVGLVALGVCCVLAWYGTKPGVTGLPLPGLAVYWGVFTLSLLVTLYMVLLDMRFIRLMYLREEKALFDETLGSEEFRRALRGNPNGTGGGASNDEENGSSRNSGS